MISRSVRFGLGIVLASGLAACTGNAVDSPYNGTYDPTMLHYIAGRGDLYTKVVGNPFDAPQEEVERAITSTMYGAHFGPNVRFNTVRDPDNISPYWVVVMFNPARTVNPEKVCKNLDQPRAEPSDLTRVMIVFCAVEYREASITGRVTGVTDPKDARFRGLIRQMTAQLFPSRNPDTLGGGADFKS